MKVSVIIPCHNVAAHLDRALGSVLAQEHRDLEIICVDDGSTDGTAALLQAHAQRHPDRIRVVHQANKGASAARNAGMRPSTGEYLQFLDADDMLAPGKISRQVALLATSGAPDLIVGDYESVMPDGLLLPVEAEYGRAWMGLIRTKLGCTCSNLWRKQAVETAGGWPENLGSSQDYTLMFRMLRNNCTVVWDRSIHTIIFKRETGSISQSGIAANWRRYIDLRWAIKQHLVARDPVAFKAEIDALDQYLFMALRILVGHDRKEAFADRRRMLPRRFTPEVGRATTERYVLLFKLLGFAGAETMVRLLRNRHTATP